LFKFEQKPASQEQLRQFSQRFSRKIAGIAGVYDVYSLDQPLGRKQSETMFGGLVSQLSRHFYWSQDPPVLRVEVLVDHRPFSPEAMNVIDRVRDLGRKMASQWTSKENKVAVLMSGPTPYVIGVREVVGKDQVRVMVLATIVIGAIVFMMVRDLPLTIFMLLATWLTYGAALTLSQLFFVHVLGEAGMDYKVRIIVFVIVVAVGQDYNIFLVSRLLQEPEELDDAEATRRAIIRTGSVISSCGLIMAATLGSLWAGGLLLLRQLGFTLAAGILIDTFFVRPLLIPSFFLATRRRKALYKKQSAIFGHGEAQTEQG
jgi:RND superfamily putative drug exporter